MPMPLPEFIAHCERKLVECDNLAHAPLGYDEREARIYQSARRDLLQWVLEMLI